LSTTVSDDPFRVDRHGNRNAESTPDRRRLADQYVEDDLIDLVVRAVQ
jgi:hypothetical protein